MIPGSRGQLGGVKEHAVMEASLGYRKGELRERPQASEGPAIAPIRTVGPEFSTYRRPGIFLTLTSYWGLRIPCFISRSIEVPPAYARASSVCSASAAHASATLVASIYSNDRSAIGFACVARAEHRVLNILQRALGRIVASLILHAFK